MRRETETDPTRHQLEAALSKRSWLVAWAQTAAVGTTILATLFVCYELVERNWLMARLSTRELFLLHAVRGISASILVGTWAVYGVFRIRRQCETAYLRAYEGLERAVEERTRALARAQAFSEGLFDSLRDRLLVIDAKGMVVKANRVAVAALGGDDPSGKACEIANGCRGGCVARMTREHGTPVVGELRTDPCSGRIYSVDSYPIADPGGGLPLMIECARDVTEAKSMEAQLRNQEKLAAVGVLSAGIAHDIANPLASMSSELEMMETERDLSRLHASIGVIRRHVGRITRTLREMNDFARRRGDEVVDISVNVAIEDALRMVGHDPRARRVAFETQIEDGLPTLRCVEDHLVMVLVNLLINALDAMPKGGKILVRAHAAAGGVAIEVVDDGIGMTEEVKRRATEPLFTTKARGEGTGLGLSVSNDVIGALGGILSIDSHRDGDGSGQPSGTTVRLFVPSSARRLPLLNGSTRTRAEARHA